jgi:biotin carboxylase
MKRAFAAHGLPTPAHREFSTVAELCDLAPLLGYPLVIKPRDFGGSAGVIKISGEDEIAAAFEHCRSILEQYADAFHIPADAFQAEEYVAATDEISVEVLVTRGCPRVLAVTDKYLGPEPWFAELGHVVPSTHSYDSSITEIAERACEALDIELGVAHVEIRLLADGTPKLMEVGARPGGDGIMELVERVYGTSPYEWHIRACLGEEAPAKAAPRPSGTAAVAFLKAPAGRITAIDPSPSLPEPIVNLTVTAVTGDLSEPPICWRSREGFVELFWPGSPRPSRIDDHLELATSLSGSIFTTAQA